MNNPAILIAEEDKILCKDLKGRLFHHGFEVIEALDQTSVLRFFQAGKLDLVIIGSFGDNSMNGLKVAAQIRQQDSKVPLILITKHSSEARAIAALRAGFNDYFKVPFSYEDLIASVKRNLFYFSQQSLTNHKTVPRLSNDQPMIGDSAAMREIKAYLMNVASTDSTVLVTGETGTGKELAAESIHQNSLRYKKPFVCVNCAALPESLVESEMFGYERGAFTGAVASKRGKFELAEGGTIFLDEIGDMSPYSQAKILSSIERKEVYPLGGKSAIPLDVRVIAATNQDPEQLMEEGKFRPDLYYRLNVARVHMPPLRERKEDISLLITNIIENLNRRFRRNVRGLTDDAMAILFRHDWPGNVRELMNLLEAAFIDLPPRHVDFMDLPKQLQQRLKLREVISQDERKEIVFTLLETKWNKSKAAQKLRWSRTTIYRKISQYNIVEKRNRSQ